MTRLTWLQVTDVHFGQNTMRSKWPGTFDAFKTDLKKQLKKHAPITAVMLTGDIAQSGEHEQFEQASQELIDPLVEIIRTQQTEPVAVLSVPGNHDLVRQKRKTSATRQLVKSGGFFEVSDEVFGEENGEYIREIRAYFENYNNWWDGICRKYNKHLKIAKGVLPGDFSTSLVRGDLSLGVLGLNSAFLHLAEGDARGTLAITAEQATSACGGSVPEWMSRQSTCIVMTHHGPEWFCANTNKNEYPEVHIAGRCLCHIFGHAHDSAMSLSARNGNPLRRLWQGRSLFGLEFVEEKQEVRRSHGYSIGCAELQGATPTVRHFPRRATNVEGWIFQRDDQFRLNDDDGGTIVEERVLVERESSSTRAAGTVVTVEAPTQYLRDIAEQHRHISLVELPLSNEDAALPMRSVYVLPQFCKSDIKPTTAVKDWPNMHSVGEVLVKGKHLVVLGDPGCGKSTLISFLSWRIASGLDASEPLFSEFADSIPLPFVLRDLNIKSDVTWDSLVREFVNKHKTISVEQVESFLASGRALVMLDGVDEVSNVTVRRKLRDAIHVGIGLYPKSTWVISSRIVGYASVPMHMGESPSDTSDIKLRKGPAKSSASVESIEAWYVAPFSDAQIQDFSARWMSIYETDAERRGLRCDEFYRALQENAGTRQLARIPFLLTLMVILYHKNSSLPDGRADLYRRIASAYLESIDLRRRLDSRPYSLAQKQRWLSQIAFNMQVRRGSKRDQNGQILASKGDIVRWLRIAMKDSGVPSGDAADVLEYFSTRSGLLLPRGVDRYSFMHLSIQEFFAAVFLETAISKSRFSDDGGLVPIENLRKWGMTASWRETFVLLFELLAGRPSSEAEAFLSYLQKSSAGSIVSAQLVDLVAEISADKFVQLKPQHRRESRNWCWSWYVKNPKFVYETTIASRFVRESGGDIRAAWKMGGVDRRLVAQMKTLNLSGCASTVDLTALKDAKALERVVLSGCVGVVDVSPLTALKHLRYVDLSGCTSVSGLDWIAGCSCLESLVLSTSSLVSQPILTRSLRDLHVHCGVERVSRVLRNDV